MNKFYLNIEKELTSRKKSFVNDMTASNKNLNIKVEDKKYKIAAILFPLIEKNKKVNVILTTRSKDVASHPGQVCFPGGKLDKKDKNIIDCAKREAFEEVGIKNNQKAGLEVDFQTFWGPIICENAFLLKTILFATNYSKRLRQP